MAYQSWSVVFGEQPSAAKWNILGTNDASFNDGTGIGTNAIAAASLATTAITLGYTAKSSTFTTATSGSYVDITGLTTTVTVPAGSRRCEIILWAAAIATSAVAGTEVRLAIQESTTVLAEALLNQPVPSYSIPATAMYSAVLSPGSHTYKATIRSSAAGNASLIATDATRSAFILVKAI